LESDVLERPHVISPVDQAMASVSRRLDRVRGEMSVANPHMNDDEIDYAIRRDPAWVLASEVVRLRREVERLRERDRRR